MSQTLPVNGFEWLDELSQFKEDFIKNYDENSNKGIRDNKGSRC